MCACLLFFIGTDCKTERVGIRIRELTFKQLYTDQESAEFKGLESSLLSAVSYFKHAFNDCDQIYLSNRPQVSVVYKLINHAGCW